MIKNKNRLRIPLNHPRMISPAKRVEVFKEITSKYQSYFGIKCIYAFLNTDPRFKIDYCLIFKAKNDDKTHDIILFDAVPINGDRCTPNYLYYKNVGKEKNFYQFGIEVMPLLPPKLFYNQIQLLGFDRDKNSDKYWKKPENAIKVVDELFDWTLPCLRQKVLPPMD